ncbi:MAG: hypothetical protein ACYCV7_08715 [Acidimicrobiales bacterium]
MAVYSDLLSLAMADDPSQELDAPGLFEVLVATSARLVGTGGERMVDETLALELAHDRVLIALCWHLGISASRHLGISASPLDFQSPIQARARLTGALEERRPEWSRFLHPEGTPAGLK